MLNTGESSSPLPAAHRLIYIRYGSVIANGATLTQDQFAYHDDPLSLQGEAEMSEIWRWELSAPNETPQLLSGTDTLSLPKLTHVITTLEAEPGTNWLFRLDSVTSAAGRITPRHRHRGPGIRCLYQGNFNVQSDRIRRERSRQAMPGGKPVRKPWSRGIRNRCRRSFYAVSYYRRTSRERCRTSGKATFRRQNRIGGSSSTRRL